MKKQATLYRENSLFDPDYFSLMSAIGAQEGRNNQPLNIPIHFPEVGNLGFVCNNSQPSLRFLCQIQEGGSGRCRGLHHNTKYSESVALPAVIISDTKCIHCGLLLS